MIKITAMHFWSDDTEFRKYEIDEKKIRGFKIHYRCDASWHIEVCEKKDSGNYSYELSHQITPKDMAIFLSNKDINIIEITNVQNVRDFREQLMKIMEWSKNV